MKQNKITIGLVDDHVVMREGVKSLLEENEEFEVLFGVSNGVELFEELKLFKPDILILDIEMPKMAGETVLRKLYPKHDTVSVIMMTMHFNDRYISEYISMGAKAFLSKSCSMEELEKAITEVYYNGYYHSKEVSEAIASRLANNAKTNNDISPREIELIRLLCKGYSNKQIADELNISIRTVESHRKNIKRKTGCKSGADLAIYAKNNQLIPN